jgi:hypothetical protein
MKYGKKISSDSHLRPFRKQVMFTEKESKLITKYAKKLNLSESTFLFTLINFALDDNKILINVAAFFKKAATRSYDDLLTELDK